MSDLFGALRALAEGDVEFVIVGGVAAVLNGAPVNTFDLDIVPARNEANVARMIRVPGALGAVYRMHGDWQIAPSESHLASPGHHNLRTRYGALDVMGTIGAGLSFRDLLPHTVGMDLGDGLSVRVLDLETIVKLKEELGTEKDVAVLPVLRRTLEQKRKI